MIGMEEINLMLLRQIPLRVFGTLMGFLPSECIVVHLVRIVLPFLIPRSVPFLVLELFGLFLDQTTVQ
jgi:hypothetical protein